MARGGRYVLTAKRRAALRKAQLASARKRRRAGAPARKRKRAATRKTIARRARTTARVTANVAAVSTLLIGPVATYRIGKAGVKAPFKGAKAAHSFGKGFHRGYSTSRARHHAARRNMARAGGTRVERVGPLALTQSASRQTRNQRRRY